MGGQKKTKAEQEGLNPPYGLLKVIWPMIFEELSANDLVSIHCTSQWFHQLARHPADLKLARIAEKYDYKPPAPGLKFEELYFSNDTIPETIGTKKELFRRIFSCFKGDRNAYEKLFVDIELDEATITNLHPLLKCMLVRYYCQQAWRGPGAHYNIITDQNQLNLVALINSVQGLQGDKMLAALSLLYVSAAAGKTSIKKTLNHLNTRYKTELTKDMWNDQMKKYLTAIFYFFSHQRNAPPAFIKYLIDPPRAAHLKWANTSSFLLGMYRIWRLGLLDTHADIAKQDLNKNGWEAFDSNFFALAENQRYLLDNMAILNTFEPYDEYMPTWKLEEFLTLSKGDKILLRKLKLKTIDDFRQFQSDLKELNEETQTTISIIPLLRTIDPWVRQKLNTAKRLHTFHRLRKNGDIQPDSYHPFGENELEKEVINYCDEKEDFCATLTSIYTTQPIKNYSFSVRKKTKLTTFFTHFLFGISTASSENQQCLKEIGDISQLPKDILENVTTDVSFDRIRIILRLKKYRLEKHMVLRETKVHLFLRETKVHQAKLALLDTYSETSALWHHSSEILEKYVRLASCAKSSDLIVFLLKQSAEFINNISFELFKMILKQFIEYANADITVYEWLIINILPQKNDDLDIVIQQLKKLTSQITLKAYIEEKIKKSNEYEIKAYEIAPNWFELIVELIGNRNEDQKDEFLRQLFNPDTELFKIFNQIIACNPLEFVDALRGTRMYNDSASTRACNFYSRAEPFQYFDKKCDFVHLFHFYINRRSFRVFEKDLVYKGKNAIQWLSKPSHKILTEKLLMAKANKDAETRSLNQSVSLSFERIQIANHTIYTGELSEQKTINNNPQKILELFIQYEILDDPIHCLSLLQNVGMNPEKLAEELNPRLESKLKRKSKKTKPNEDPIRLNFALNNKPEKANRKKTKVDPKKYIAFNFKLP